MRSLHSPSPDLPQNIEGAVFYAESMANGVKLWVWIDSALIVLAIFLRAIGFIDGVCLIIVISMAISCPLIMTGGYYFGCREYLRPTEFLKIVAVKVKESGLKIF